MPGKVSRESAGRARRRDSERALNPALHGCETFDFGPMDMAELRNRLRAYPGFSVHAPLPTPPHYPGSPSTSFLLDPDPSKRQASLDMLQNTIGRAAAWGAKYVVVHFGGLHSDGLTADEIHALADSAANQLDDWARHRRMPLHVEYAAYNPGFATVQDLIELVASRSYLHVCLDVGHLRIGAQVLESDEWDMAAALAPYTRSMHLWTVRNRDDVRLYHHVPVHPQLSPAEGWIDIPRMLDVILRHSPECAVVFEPHDAYNPSPDWQGEGIAWVRDLVAGHRAQGK